jgi:nicotinate-nucleotide adenylyltransferase
MELCAPGPSYTADTLERFHAGNAAPASQIFFITGADAFAEIETWHRSPEVLGLANFVVVSRPGTAVSSLKARLPALASRMRSAAMVHEEPAEPAIFLLDAKTPDISSTNIRRRLAGGQPLGGLVPPSVAAHIAQHNLYADAHHVSGADDLHGQD